MRICSFVVLSYLMLWIYEGEGKRCFRRQFACADGTQCIPAFRFCDGKVHCRDRSDERRPQRFTIAKGLRCRKGRRVCLLDRSYAPRKSIFCQNAVKAITCRPDEFKCKDGSACIKLSKFCDGKDDCRDGSDEQKRGLTRNAFKQRPCRIGKNVCVLPFSLRSKREDLCDKDFICWDDEYKCDGGNKCIPWHWFCDGDADCKDGTDEIPLPTDLPGIACHRRKKSCLLPEAYNPKLFCEAEIRCFEDEFKCLDGTQCIPWNKFCTCHAECKDGSDESGVNSRVAGTLCRKGRNICVIPRGLEYMHEELCLPVAAPLRLSKVEANGSTPYIENVGLSVLHDEMSTVSKPLCREDEFACSDKTQCIPWSRFCDGMRSCRDGSDEIHINSTIPGVPCRVYDRLCVLPQVNSYKAEDICRPDAKCSNDEYRCLSGNQCVQKKQFCDGSFDCKDLSDEIEPKQLNSGIPCRRQRRTCVLPNERSDLEEELCSEDRYCMSGFHCSDGTQCIPPEWFCDGKTHCRDGSDEFRIGGRFTRKYSGIRCQAGKNVCALPVAQAYKRSKICRRDEVLRCKPGEFQCLDKSKCLKPEWFCDGESYCKDKSDSVVSKMTLKEGDIRCRYDDHICVLPKSQQSKKKYLCRKGSKCNVNEYMCRDGSRCLEAKYFCDGSPDCSDGSDEISPASDVKGVTCRGIRNSWFYAGSNRGTAGGNWCVLPEEQKSKKKWLCNH